MHARVTLFLTRLHHSSSNDIARCRRMNAKQRRRMSRRPKPIPGVETRTARARRYHRWLERSLLSCIILLVCSMYAAFMLVQSFLGRPPHPTTYHERKAYTLQVVLYVLIGLMQLCGMSMHAIRVLLICIIVVSLLGAGAAWWTFVRIGTPKPKPKDLH